MDNTRGKKGNLLFLINRWLRKRWWFCSDETTEREGIEKKKDANNYNQVARQNMDSIPRGE